MFHSAPVGSHERHLFLEGAQTLLVEALGQKAVIQALGEATVDRLKAANELLIIPNIRDDRVIIPECSENANGIPLIALKPGETVHIGSEFIMPSPAQLRRIRQFTEVWAEHEEHLTAAEIDERLLEMMRDELPADLPASIPKGMNGDVIPYNAKIVGDDIGLEHANPLDFYLNGRPAVVISHSGDYNSPVALSHELTKLRRALDRAHSAGDDDVRLRDRYRDELIAHHYSTLYVSALHAGDGRVKRRLHAGEIALYRDVDAIRRQFADPHDPFEPTDTVIDELRNEGIEWHTDY